MSVNYNIGARYNIIGRIPQGTTVIAYVLKDSITGNITSLEKGVVEQLALNKQIYNCTAQIYGNIVNLKGIQCKLSKLPRYNPDLTPYIKDKQKNRKTPIIKLVGKVQNGRSISDYVVESLKEPGRLMKVPRDTIIKLAQEGLIINAKAQMNGQDIMLRGANGFNLSQLQLYK